MTRLTIEGLTKRFDEVVAVDDVDLDIADHELISLLGPSGCGKTTTLRCIAGFETPSSGRIAFDGQDIVRLQPERRDIGMVFQSYALFPHMTVTENLAFGLEMRRIARAEIERRTLQALETVQLADLGRRYPRQLSGGQQQRVALARALVIEPRVLLLDEPLANLDAKLREEVRFFIRQLQKRVGITTVYVTHDQAEAMVISDRIVVMFDGRVHQIGSPIEIYSKPASREVARFIGLSNFIEARVRTRDGANGWLLDSPLGPLHCASGELLDEGAPVSVVVRPEVIELAARAPQGDRGNVIEGRVAERYFLGNLAGYRIACAGDTMLQVQSPPWLAFEVGDPIWCRFGADRTWIIRG
jgi:putative spermidine/putrescine transport system ATP-binding protein